MPFLGRLHDTGERAEEIRDDPVRAEPISVISITFMAGEPPSPALRSTAVTPELLCRHIVDTYPGTDVIEANGDLFFVHDPDRDLPDVRRRPWATIVTSNHNDADSDLDRPGVYRLNIGLPKADFRELFPEAGEHDTTALDVVLPHPVYAAQHWVCVLVPDRTWPAVQDLLDRAHAFGARKHAGAVARRQDPGT